MAYTLQDLTLKGLCPFFRETYARVAGANNPAFLNSRYGFLENAWDNRNVLGAKISIDPRNNGTTQEVRLVYKQAALDTDVETDRTVTTCVGTESDMFEQSVTVDDWIGTPWMRITRQRLRQLCEDQTALGSFFMNEVLRNLVPVRKKWDELIGSYLLANCVGLNMNNLVSATPSAAAKSLDFLDADGNAIAPALADLMQDYRINEMSETPGIVGDGILERWAYQLGWGCCNDAGADLAQVNDWYSRGSQYYVSANASDTLGTNNFLLTAPGAHQVLTFNENLGAQNEVWNDNFAHTVIPDPILPINWDFNIKYSACGQFYDFRVGIHYKTWCWANDVFQAADARDGMNGIFLYTAAQKP